MIHTHQGRPGRVAPVSLMITVQVRLYATLRRRFPSQGLGETMPVALPDRATVGQLIENLALPAEQVKVVFVNQRIRPDDTILNDGDQIGIFPPVGGG